MKAHVMPTVAIAHADQAGGAMDILEEWAQELKKSAYEMGYTVIDICGSDLTYEGLTDILQATKPAVLFNFSMGTECCLIGNDMKCMLTGGRNVTSCMTPTCTFEGEPLKLRCKNNLNVVAGTAVIAYSSRAASQLGQEIIKAGSPAFVGFSEYLIIVSDNTGTQDIFKESLLPLAKRILEGWTVGNVVKAAHVDLLNKIKEYKVKGYDLISMPLFYNEKSLTLLGDPNWKLKGV